MMTDKPPPELLDENDRELFRRAVSGSRPLHPKLRQARVARPDPGTPGRHHPLRTKLEPATKLQTLESGKILSYLRPGLQKSHLRRLRRGQYPIADTLDLHGLGQRRAEKLLLDFLDHCQRQRFQGVRIIHGKGLRSPAGRAILKTLCNHLLRRHPLVLAFHSSSTANGGSGAVDVLLRTEAGKNRPG